MKTEERDKKIRSEIGKGTERQIQGKREKREKSRQREKQFRGKERVRLIDREKYLK